jgi:hypothetical protein
MFGGLSIADYCRQEVGVEFYSTAAQVIPTLLVVAALQSKLLSWAADKYGNRGIQKRMGQLVMFSIGGSLICEAIALGVLASGSSSLLSCWNYDWSSSSVA